MDWNKIVRLARSAFRIGKARIQGGTVRRPSAVLIPESLASVYCTIR
jgi:hypothetical protein